MLETLIQSIVEQRLKMIEERLVSLGITKENAKEYRMVLKNEYVLSPEDEVVTIYKGKKKIATKTFTTKMVAEVMMNE